MHLPESIGACCSSSINWGGLIRRFQSDGTPWEVRRLIGEFMEKIRIEQHSFMGGVWFAAWLFTIGFLHLAFWRGVLAIILWPYYIGTMFSAHLRLGSPYPPAVS